jgi:TonB family protein
MRLGLATVPDLVTAFEKGDSATRETAAQALEKIDPVLARQLIWKRRKRQFIRWGIAAALVFSLQVVGSEFSAFHDGEPPATYRLYRLGVVSQSEAISALTVTLGNEDANARTAAVETLEKIDPNWARSEAVKEAVPELLAVLKKPGESLNEMLQRMNTSWTMSGADRKAVPVFVAGLSNSDATTRATAAAALGKIGPSAAEAVPALIAALEDKDFTVREWAVWALGEIGPGAKAAVPRLREVVKESDYFWLGRVAAQALGKIGPGSEETVPTLIELLKSRYDEIRLAAAQALGKIGPGANSAIPALQAARRDKDSNVRSAAAQALAVIRTASNSVEPLATSPSGEPESVKKTIRVSSRVLQDNAIRRTQPTYPPTAQQERISGAVEVEVLTDESGNVISAKTRSGHPLLRQAALEAARKWKFRPTLVNGQPVRVTGVLVFDF